MLFRKFVIGAGLLGMAIAPAAAQDNDTARGAKPKDIMQWAGEIQRSYPAAALRNAEEGTVTMEIGIDAKGRVESCNVVRSSGSSALDTAGCEGMRLYARYEPARDAEGRPVASTATQSIRYVLPDSSGAPNLGVIPIDYEQWREIVFDKEYAAAIAETERGAALFFLTLDIEGMPTGCGMMYSSGDPALDQEGCDRLIEHAKFLPPELPDGQRYPGVAPIPFPSFEKIPGVTND